MFKSLKRLIYKVPDLEKAKEWYCNILNTQPVYDAPFAVIFQIGSDSLSLLPAPQAPKDNERIGAFWEVDDADDAYNRLIAAGAVPHTELKTIFNIRTGMVIDPFGNVIGITGKVQEDSKNTTVENKPSETALMVAFCRALAANEDREELKGGDYLAELFLPEDRRQLLKDKAARESVIVKAVSERLYGYFMARTAYLDSIFKQALIDEIPQIVFLGAGYDSRSYRFSKCIKATRIFELDIHTTQQRKKEILAKANVQIPEQLSFVTINFKNDKLDDVLSKAGYDSSKKTLFIWEGVTYYLDEEAVNNTLKFIKTNSPVGSILCFDYMSGKLESIVAGEPFKFWIEKTNIATFLSDKGFNIVEHITPTEMEDRFLSLKDGTVAVHTIPFFCLVDAEVAG